MIGSMTAYWIGSYLEITDAAKVAAYAELAGPAITAAGGTFLARGLPAAVQESGRQERTVVVAFETLDEAVAAYETPAYRAALDALGDGAVRDLRIVPGVE